MLRNKRILLILFIAIVVFLIPSICNATEVYNDTTNSGEIEINWEYGLNKNGEIIGLKCTSVSNLPENFTIPSTISGKKCG